MEAALTVRLLGDAATSAMIDDRLHWKARPQDEPLPALVLAIVADPRPQHLDGFHSLRPTRLQLECFGRTYLEAVDLREAVIAALVAKVDVGNTRFDLGLINNTMDRGEDTAGGFVHCQLVDATLWHGPKETS